MSHSMKYKRLAKKLGVKEMKPGALLAKAHTLKGMPKMKKHKFGTGKALAQPFEKKHKSFATWAKEEEKEPEHKKKHKEIDFKKHKCMKKHKHSSACE